MKKKNTKYQNFSKESLIERLLVYERRKKFGLVWEESKEDVIEKSKDGYCF